MASGQEILIDDLPPELTESKSQLGESQDWQQALSAWCFEQLDAGNDNILEQALPAFERTMIECALRSTAGHKQLAAKKLGWGRNTLTRKLKELNMS